MAELSGKTAIVTGGGSGIGYAAAIIFAREGANVVIADIDETAGESAAAEIRKAGGQAMSCRTDVASEDSVKALVHATITKYGAVDLAFNNAGFPNQMNETADMDLSEWKRVLSVNLTGVFLCMKYEIQAMLKNGGGAIVNTSSIAGMRNNVMLSPYVASKTAIIGMTKTAAAEYAGRGIRINAICPGLVDTSLNRRMLEAGIDYSTMVNIPMGRLADPAEIGEAAVFLCLPRAAYITGHALVADGGLTAA